MRAMCNIRQLGFRAFSMLVYGIRLTGGAGSLDLPPRWATIWRCLSPSAAAVHTTEIPFKMPLRSGERGIALVEVLIAVAILAIATTAYLSALSTTSIAIGKEDRRVTANALAISTVHATRSQSYIVAPSSYPIITQVPQGYSVTSNAEVIAGRDDNVQKIKVIVEFKGRVISVLEDFKVNR